MSEVHHFSRTVAIEFEFEFVNQLHLLSVLLLYHALDLVL